MNSITSRRTRLTYRVLSAFIAVTFSFTSVIPPSYAQSIASLNLPVPGAMVVHSAAFVPVLLKGMTVHLDNPLQFDFIIDSGNTDFKEDQIKTESERLVKYFLASMTIPKDDLWVNLSPYESDKIIPEALGKTELGRDMLAQDYILKQLTASLMYPEKELGKEFWDKVYKKAQEKYGTTEIPVDTFNKVWILPETATVYEHGQTVYIVEARLRVMLDSDYLAMSHNVTTSQSHKDGTGDVVTGDLVTPQVIREIILPEIEREVNEGQNFAPLRQIYHSLILAKWYKKTIKNSLLSKIYVDQKKIAGVESGDETLKDQIYARYMEAYKKGVFNYIKEDYDRLSNETIPRKYFSGGETLTQIPLKVTSNPVHESNNPQYVSNVEIAPQKSDESRVKQSSSPVSIDDLLTVSTGLIGALEENGQILSVKAGELVDVSFGDASSSPIDLYPYWEKYVYPYYEAILGPNYETIMAIGGSLTVLYYIIRFSYPFWDRRFIITNIESTNVKERRNAANRAQSITLDLAKPFWNPVIRALIPHLNDSDKEVVESVIAALLFAQDAAEPALGRLMSVREKKGLSDKSMKEVDHIIEKLISKKITGKDNISSSPISSEAPGGIDMNAIDLDKQGGGVDIQFDPAQLQELIDVGIDGFAPVIINITPLPSVLPLLGLDPAIKEELEVSSLN